MRASTKGSSGCDRRALPEPIHFGERRAEVPRRDVCVHHRAVRAERRRLGRDPAPGRGQRLGPGTPDGGRHGGAVHERTAVGRLGHRERIRRHQRERRMRHGRAAEHRLHVVVRERVVGIQGERPAERADGLRPVRRLVGAGRVVEPGLAESVPGIGVRLVPREELLVGRPRVRILPAQEGAVRVDHGTVVRREASPNARWRARSRRRRSSRPCRRAIRG